MKETLLKVEKVDTFYGSIHILQQVNLEVGVGELVCLLGGNACGKSTTLKTILGIVKPKAGSITFAGQDVTNVGTPGRVRLGMAVVPENRRLFAPMTVLENLKIGAFVRGEADPADLERVFELFPKLKDRQDQLAGTLSGGEQQMLAVARILRTGARLLLLDEISEGLAPVIVQALARMITTLKAKGYTIVMVEQNFRFAAPLADRFYVMEHGQIVESFASSQLEAKMQTLNELLGV